ncbi:hypothetical protein Tco_0302756 [Tanacetum coccineum]
MIHYSDSQWFKKVKLTVDLENLLFPDEKFTFGKDVIILKEIQPNDSLSKIHRNDREPFPMIALLEISRRARNRYHNLAGDVMIKSIFNSGKSKDVVVMKILDWMITDEIMLKENYQLYAEVFRVDVPTTQSQPIESTQERNMTT